MEKHPHLLVCISGHGYGHLAQVAPVLNALHAQRPEVHLTLRTSIPQPLLRQRIRAEFQYLQESTDFGMHMHSALEVDVTTSLQAYSEFHADWQMQVANEVARLQALAPDLVLTDVAYLPLAAAAQLGLPSVSLCSLNWADIFRHFCGHAPGAARILQEIEAAYASSTCFLQPAPSMPMSWLPHRQAIGAIADPGVYRRAELDTRLQLTPQDRLILVSMGGIVTQFSVEHWPRLPGVKWLVQADWLQHSTRSDMRAFESLTMPFSDLLASCDLLMTKPGYGAFAEAAANGVPVLFVRREEWPEQEYLVTWLTAVGRCLGIDTAQATRGDFDDELRALLLHAKPSPVEATGNLEAAQYLLRQLGAA